MPQIGPNTLERDVAAEVADLAARHGVSYRRTDFDDLAHHISRLSDAEVEPDETENLLIALVRAKIVDEAERARLHGAYLRQLGYR